jgi:biopolymer transport protein ExbB/TolQ
MGTSETIIRFFQEGGLFMYPIALVLALGVAIAVERWFFLTAARAVNRKEWDSLLPVLNGGDYQRAYNMTSQSEAAVSKILNYGLSRLGTTNRLEDVEAAMEEGLMEISPRLEKRTHYLATFANLATLLGLLGTIIGLIEAFAAVASADPGEKAQLLSSSISVAMNTTAFGLIVAIPLLLIYAVLQAKTTELLDSLEMAAVKFNNMVRRHRAPAPTQTPGVR